MNPAQFALYTEDVDGTRHLENVTTLEQFAADNELDAAEVFEIQKELDTHGESYFGGGAAPVFVLTPHDPASAQT